MIYFVQPTDGGPIKIGFSGNVAARHKSLELHYGKPLAILAIIPGGRDEEREIHERFSHLRLGRTEQFRPASDLMAFIGRPLLVDANPDSVEALPSVANKKPLIMQLRGSDQFRGWLQGLADADGLPVSILIDRALRLYAKSVGFMEPAPKR